MYCIAYLIVGLQLIRGVNAVAVDLGRNIIGVVGRNDTELHCTFTKEDVQQLYVVYVDVRNKTTNTFETIVSFNPDRASVLTSSADYLYGRVKHTNITQSSTVASITFNQLQCVDDNAYTCTVSYQGKDNKPHTEVSGVTNISVQVPPSKPKPILMMIKPNEMTTVPLVPKTTTIANDNTTVFSSSDAMENRELMFSNTTLAAGDNVAFLCAGDVGNPRRTFLWQKIDQSGHITQYSNISTIFEQISGECYYNGSSELTYTVTAEDNQATMRCLVENMGEFSRTTEPLEVYYKVRKPTITKYPDQLMYGTETETLLLNCSSNGNPPPSILWKKDEEILGDMNVLEIANILPNNSGTYECVANNSVRSKVYTENASVIIRIVDKVVTTTPAPTVKPTQSPPETVTSEKKDSKPSIALIVGVAAAVVIVIVIAVIILYVIIRQKRKSKGYMETTDSTDIAMRHNQNNKRTNDAYSSIALDDKPKPGETKGNPYTDNMTHNLAYLKNEEETQSSEKNPSEQPAVYAVVNKQRNQNSDHEDTKPEDPYAIEKEGEYDTAFDSRHKADEKSETYDRTTDITQKSY